jgi:hypothetical protein
VADANCFNLPRGGRRERRCRRPTRKFSARKFSARKFSARKFSTRKSDEISFIEFSHLI